ncbi:hypothetical protein MYCTH_2050335, partial [Thermothelomyces thermophilus ATCC 42464]
GACEPALNASFLQVKKEGANKGRWFYTCQKPREEQCRFFLWEDAARAREKSARNEPSVFNRPRTRRPASSGGTPQWDIASTVTSSGPLYSPASSIPFTPGPRQRIFRGVPRAGAASWSSDEDEDEDGDDSGADDDRRAGTTTPTPKRKRSDVDDAAAPDAPSPSRNAATDLSDLDAEMADELVEVTNQAERLHRPRLAQPPHHRSQISGPHTTPSRAGLGRGDLSTPESGNSFASVTSGGPDAKRLRTARGVPVTPTPARTRNALAGAAAQRQSTLSSPATATTTTTTATTPTATTPTAALSPPGNSHEGDAEITTTVLSLLRAEPVSAAARRAVREELNRHARRARGVEQARDSLRQTLRARETALAELRARVAQLENERRMRREVLRSDLLALSQEDLLLSSSLEGEGEGDGEGEGEGQGQGSGLVRVRARALTSGRSGGVTSDL